MKKTLISITLLLSLSSHSFVSMEDREAINVEGLRLSPFWATEFVGADLVKKKIKQRKDAMRVPFSIFDIGFEKDHIKRTIDINVDQAMNGHRRVTGNHGTSVANVINGAGLQSTTDIVDYVQLAKVSPAVFYFGAISALKKLEIKPMIISNSVGWSSEEVAKLAKEVDEMGIVWVLAAGNDYPEKMVDFESRAPVIKVGSYSPFGLQTIYSQESSELTIMAPGDEYLASIDGKGHKTLFGATSGATPIVSGTIANVKAILPSLTRIQVEKLIKKTAIRSLNFYYREIKTGLFNGFKFFMAATVIKDKCESDLDCIDYEIENFKDVSFLEKRDHEQAIKYCSYESDTFSKDGLDSLREDFLLNPSDEKLPLLLSCVYQRAGLSLNAKFYKNIYLIYHDPKKMMKEIGEQANAAIEKGYGLSSSLRDIELYNEVTFELLEEVVQNDKGIGAYHAKEILERAKREGLR